MYNKRKKCHKAYRRNEVKAYLRRYQDALKDIEYLSERKNAIEDKLFSSGLIAKYGLNEASVSKNIKSDNRKEKLLTNLLSQKMAIEVKMEVAEKICLEVERLIDTSCSPQNGLVLSCHYILDLPFTMVAEQLSLAYPTVLKAHRLGVEEIIKGGFI